jgi:membrane-associated phospholipid phosphatase
VFPAWRRRVPALLPGLAAAGGLVLTLTVELVVGRGAPPAQYAVIASSAPGSFPALAVTVTTAVAEVLAVQACLTGRSWGRAVTACTAALLWAGGAGLSAAYLGTHWPTDILGAWALGAAWGAVLLTAWHTWSRLRRTTHPPATERDAATEPHHTQASTTDAPRAGHPAGQQGCTARAQGYLHTRN